jgi:hypothetical protein
LKTHTSRWLASNELSKLEPVVEHNLHFAGQTGHAGLGSVNTLYIANPSIRERRQKITEALFSQKRIACDMPRALFGKACGQSGKMSSLLTSPGKI